VSRAATFLPSIRALSLEELARVRRLYPRQSFRDLLRSLSLPDAPFLALGARCGIEDAAAAPPDAALAALCADPHALDAFDTERARARSLLRDYLARLGLFQGGRVALVDVGWTGSMQDNLVRAFGDEPGFPEVRGLYLACADRAAPVAPGSTKEGFLADVRRGRAEDADVFRNASLFEVAATPGHGTTAGYRRGRHGEVVPVLAPHSVEQRNHAGGQRRTQEIVYAYARALARLRPAFPFTAEELRPGALHALMRYVRYPTGREAREFLAYSHVEGFGVHEVTTFDVAPSAAELARRPVSALAEALRRFRTNRWREGAVRRSGVPLANLVYDAWWTARNHR
jgi:hypothetical protein